MKAGETWWVALPFSPKLKAELVEALRAGKRITLVAGRLEPDQAQKLAKKIIKERKSKTL